MKIFLLLCSFCFIIQGQSQTIITAAGTGAGSSTGDGGPFSKATFNRPIHIVHDKAGNLYISELRGGRIRRVDAVSGIITTLIGGLYYPSGFAFDRQEQFMYIAANYCVYKFNMSTKQLTVIAGIPGTVCYSYGMCGEGGPALKAIFGKSTGVAVDSVGDVYVADENNSRIRKIDMATGIITTYAGSGGCNCPGRGDGGPANKAQLLFPHDILFDNEGNLLIADAGTQNVRKVDYKTGIITTIAGLDTSPGWGYTGDGGPAINARLHAPVGIFVDKNDNLYIAEDLNHIIRKVDKAGIITTIAGTGTVAGYSGDCGPANKALFNAPYHAVVTPTGSILVADFINNVIREIINSAPNVIVASTKSVCVNSTITLKNLAEGGVWQSSDPAIAKVNSSGVVTAVSEGSVDISYYISNGCNSNSANITITVYPVPSSPKVQGASAVCEASSINLTNTGAGGVWSSSDSSIALPNAQGLIKGISPGSAMIKYTVSDGRCTNGDSLKIVVNPLPKVSAVAGDTSVCVNSTTNLTNASEGGTWSISNTSIATINSATGVVFGKSAGTAILGYTLTNGCGAAVTQASLKVNALPFFSLGNDTSICVNDKIQLQPLINNVVYWWEDGSELDKRLVSEAGSYFLKVIDGNQCTFSDTINIKNNPLPALLLGNDTTLCNNNWITLNVNNGLIREYQWQDGSMSPLYTIRKKGTYSVTVKGFNGCINKDTIHINYLNSPVVNLGNNRTICDGNPVIINPQLNNVTYLWQDGSTQPTFTATQPGVYSLMATNFCGTTTARVEFKKGLCRLEMPNVFTPNNDGLNDAFGVKFPDFIKTFRMRIFDRWGKIIFDTTNPLQGWDGKYKGLNQDTGNYTWLITLTDLHGKTENASGSVLLIR